MNINTLQQFSGLWSDCLTYDDKAQSLSDLIPYFEKYLIDVAINIEISRLLIDSKEVDLYQSNFGYSMSLEGLFFLKKIDEAMKLAITDNTILKQLESHLGGTLLDIKVLCMLVLVIFILCITLTRDDLAITILLAFISSMFSMAVLLLLKNYQQEREELVAKLKDVGLTRRDNVLFQGLIQLHGNLEMVRKSDEYQLKKLITLISLLNHNDHWPESIKANIHDIVTPTIEKAYWLDSKPYALLNTYLKKCQAMDFKSKLSDFLQCSLMPYSNVF